jgi:hypothetical protein
MKRISCFLFGVVLLIAGCGDTPRSKIHGTIKYQGKPLTNATLTFFAKDNSTHMAILNPDGTYTVDRVPRGPIKVSIQSDVPRPASKGQFAKGFGEMPAETKDGKRDPAPGPAEPKATWPIVPANYNDPEKSGLSFELKEPDQEWSVELK